MQRFLKAVAAILLTVAVICAAGCKKTDDPNNNGNNNGGNNNGGSNSEGSISGGGNNGGHNGGTAEGMYVGVIGFNEALYTKEISLLNSSTEGSFLNFIEGLSMRDATALYHADNTALDWLRDATLPADLINVSLVTFTDGLDNASLMLDDHYSSQAEFLNAVNNRIMNDKVQGKSINAYAIGMKGNDVVDEEGFRQNLRKLSSSESNVFEVEDMDEATERFSEIASQLYNESTTFGVSVKIPGGYDNNTVVRITFDNVSEANSSSRYIQATYSREGENGKLSDVSYNGLQSLSGTSIIDSRQDGLFYWFTFMELRTLDNEPVTDMTHTKLWRTVGSTAEWQPESEFTPSGYSDVVVERKSAVTVLVLDCTTSLGTQDFRKMKDAAKEFIRVLDDNGGGHSTLPTVKTNEVTDITSTTAIGGGRVTSNGGTAVIERGICWDTSHNPTTSGSHASNGTGTGSYTCNIIGLTSGTTYYVRAYATNSHGTSYGDEVSFITVESSPTVITNQVTNITQTTATSGGNVTATGGATVTERGICWSTNHNPTTSSSHANNGTGTGSYTVNMTGLTANTTYYVRAYAINSMGTAYGNEVNFTTSQLSSYTISVSTNPNNGGTVTGGGTYQQGQSCTVSAIAATGYTFIRWTENGSQISTNANYTFTVTSNRALVAKFVSNGGSYNGHAYVDLGLPSGLLWATCNVGAAAPEGYGDYFAWGEIQSKNTYDWSTYQYCNGSFHTLTKYCFTDNLIVLETSDDVAAANWGNGWRMPTKEEWQELFDNTTNTWTIQNGIYGRCFAANGNSLFLPAAGYRDENSLFNVGIFGNYWSSSLYTVNPARAWGPRFSSDHCIIESLDHARYRGLSVRPVHSNRNNHNKQ